MQRLEGTANKTGVTIRTDGERMDEPDSAKKQHHVPDTRHTPEAHTAPDTRVTSSSSSGSTKSAGHTLPGNMESGGKNKNGASLKLPSVNFHLPGTSGGKKFFSMRADREDSTSEDSTREDFVREGSTREDFTRNGSVRPDKTAGTDKKTVASPDGKNSGKSPRSIHFELDIPVQELEYFFRTLPERVRSFIAGQGFVSEQDTAHLSEQERLIREQRIRKQKALERESRKLANGPIDAPFCLLVILLTAIGLVMLLSASFPSAYYDPKIRNPTYFFVRQGVFVIMGLSVMFLISRINYQRLRGIAKVLLYVSLHLLVLVLFIGQLRNNARRWIGIGDLFTFQPSELMKILFIMTFAKIAVIVYFADDISRKRDKMRTFREGIWPYMLIMGVIAVLMMMEPHLSGTVLILGTGAVMMLVGGIHLGWVVAAVGGASGLLFLMLKGFIPYGQSRIAMWKNPFIDPRGDGYQLSQSLISIGSGGLLGVGLGKSRQKFLYLPEEHNDFIFAVTCEELGLIGATLIMILFAALILRGYWIALHARDRFGSLLVVGVTTLIALQTFLNIGVVTGLLPTTGISLPFFSYGGTAILIQLAEMGIVLSVSRQMKVTKKG